MRSLWFDILIGLILVRGFFIGKKKTALMELVRVVGVYFATFFTLHYYGSLGKYLAETLKIGNVSAELWGFVIIALTISVLFYFFSEGWLFILKIEVGSAVDKYGARILTMSRYYLYCSLVFVVFSLSGKQSLFSSVQDSFSSNFLKYTSVSIYKSCHKYLVSNYFNDPLNADIVEIIEVGTKEVSSENDI